MLCCRPSCAEALLCVCWHLCWGPLGLADPLLVPFECVGVQGRLVSWQRMSRHEGARRLQLRAGRTLQRPGQDCLHAQRTALKPGRCICHARCRRGCAAGAAAGLTEACPAVLLKSSRHIISFKPWGHVIIRVFSVQHRHCLAAAAANWQLPITPLLHARPWAKCLAVLRLLVDTALSARSKAAES